MIFQSSKSNGKTILIHDIMEYAGILLPHIHRIVDQVGLAYYTSLIPENIIKWIVAKEFWLAYNISMIGCDVNDTGMLAIHQKLNEALNGELTNITLNHVASLKINDPYREIDIEIHGRELYIFYYGEVTKELYNLKGWN